MSAALPILAAAMSDAFRRRFAARCVRVGGCLEWTAGFLKTGYGYTYLKNRQVRVNRVAYALAHGVAPADLLICHSCDNKRCVDPAHLFAGTNADNLNDYIAKFGHPMAGRRRATCRHGHANYRLRSDGKRQCRTCQNESARRLKQRVA